jgi:hypothetical protein
MMTYGTAGRFIIQDVGISLPLYLKEKSSGQDIVDRENSALLCKKFRGGCDYVGDHAAQGFDRIKQCKWGTMAMIQTPTGTQIYMCVAISMGTNTGNDLVTLSGATCSHVSVPRSQLRGHGAAQAPCGRALGKPVLVLQAAVGCRHQP